MHNLSPRIQALLSTVSHCIKQSDGKAFLHGDLLLHQLTGNEELSITNKIELVVDCGPSFEVHGFYQCLLQHVVISREIESSETRYHIATSGFELILDLIHNFDPTRLVEALRFGRFNLDMIYQDIETKELKHPPEVSSEIASLKNMAVGEWSFEDILGFAEKKGIFPKLEIDPDQYQKLRNISLATVRESLNTSWEEEIENILLSRHPGSAMQFLSEVFVDGMPWSFKVLIDYLISMDVPVNEEATIETVFNQKKFDMINLYNDYFLAEKKSFETSEEVQHRLTTTLKLFFDSPNISIPKPYVNRVATMAGGQSGRCCLNTSAGFFGCGDNIDEIDCFLPPFCTGSNTECLKDHSSFAHIPENNWNLLTITDREWCPDQVCPENNAQHCLLEVSSSSSSKFASSSSSSGSSSSNSSSSSGSSSSSSQSSSSQSSSSSLGSSSSSSAFPCVECPEFDSEVTSYPPIGFWYSVSGTLAAGSGSCFVVKFTNLADASPLRWRFYLGCGLGGSESDFESEMSIVEGDCSTVPSHDDATCDDGTYYQWQISKVDGDGVIDVYITIFERALSGFGGGDFVLAFNKTSDT